MCDEWLHSFDAFMEWALSNGYQENLSIDRINNDGDYSPNNCRWADETMQVNNRSVWGEVPYHGIVRDNTGYRAQVTIKGKKVYIGHSSNDIEYLVNLRNQYIDKHNLPCKKNVFHKDNLLAEPAVLDWTRSGDSKGDPTYHPVEVANCVTAAKRDNTQNYVVEPQVQQVCNLIGDREGKFANPQRGRIDSPAGLAPAVDTAQGGNREAKIIEQAKTAHPSRGIIMIKNTPCWVRRLTERELFRLMDVDETDIDTLLNAGISNTQLAKLAGNSIVVACLYHIFVNLFVTTDPAQGTQTTLF
jgi:hypothetical protein